MNPAIVIDGRGYFTGGGIGRYTRQILPALVEECRSCGLSVRVLISNQHRPDEVELPGGGRVEVVVSRAEWMDATSEPLRLPAEVEGAGLFHSLSGHWVPDAGPSIATIHDLTPRMRPELMSADARFHGERVVEAARRATWRIAVSRTAADDLRRVLGPGAQPLSVIPEAAAPLFHGAVADPNVLGRYGLTAGEYLLTVGAGHAHKNVAGLVEAYLTSGVVAPLVIVGAIRQGAQEVARLLAQPSLSRRVFMPGVVSDVDLAALYAGSRLFVSASLREGFGLPVLEAMAAGAPVVATRSASGADLGGDAAFWVDPAETRALASAIAQLDRDPMRRSELARRGRIRAGQYSWARTAAMTSTLYSAMTEVRAA